MNDPSTIRKMTLDEYKALRLGASLRQLDELERDASLAYKTAIAGAYDKDGKAIVKSVTDLFDRKKAERELFGSLRVENSRVTKENVERFRLSKERAEAIVNGESFGEEDD